jgi:hypothetical protein
MVPHNATEQIKEKSIFAPDFLGLLSGDFEKLAQEAVRLDLQRKLDQGLPVLVWNNGTPYNQYGDGRIEYLPLPVIPTIREVESLPATNGREFNSEG